MFLPNSTEHNPTSGQDGFSVAITQLTSTPGFPPVNLLSNPFPTGLIQPPAAAWALSHCWDKAPAASCAIYTGQFDFNIQRQWPGGILLETAYVGSRGVKLPISLPVCRPNSVMETRSIAAPNRICFRGLKRCTSKPPTGWIRIVANAIPLVVYAWVQPNAAKNSS